MARSRVVTFTDRKSNMLEAIGSPRLLTLVVAGVCLILFLAQVSRSRLGAICLAPDRIVTRFEVYRIFTAPFFHGGFFHILFNTIAWMIIGRDYERATGTLAATYSIFVLLIPLIAVVHCATAYLIDALARTSFRHECAVGISGVLFALLVVNVELSPGSSVNVFGLFSMPKLWYPLALALVLQLLSPGLSLLGHLSGIALGYALVYGYLQRLSPSDYKLEDFEISTGLSSVPLWQPLTTSTGMPVAGRSALPETSETSGEASFSGGLQAGWSRMTSWFSRDSSTGTAQPFSGHGQTLGGGGSPTTAGRVPPNSRLIQEAESQSKPKPSDPIQEQGTEVESEPRDSDNPTSDAATDRTDG